MAYPTDRERFIDASMSLLATLPPAQAELVGREFKACGEAVDQGHTWEPHPLAGAAVRVILEHLSLGFPLALPAPVAEFYMGVADGKHAPGAALWQCADCGFGLPDTFPTCPLCGGRTGAGAHSIKMSLRAALN